MEFTVQRSKLVLAEGDITKVPADAIVNAANSRLAGGGGVDGAVHCAGGPSIMKELDEIRARIQRCTAGDAVVTGAGDLPAKYVIHTVGPIYQDGRQGESAQLASCYKTSLRLAEEHGARSVAFPSISTGAYGYPMDQASTLALKTVIAFLARPECRIDQVTFVLFGKAAYEAYLKAAQRELRS